MFNLDFFLRAICVKPHIYHITEQRDKKIILAISFLVYLSAVLFGYAMAVNIYFLMKSAFISLLIGLCSFAFIVLHDQSMMASSSRVPIIVKICLSIAISVSFTLTNNASKEYSTHEAHIIQETKIANSRITAKMNAELDAIDAQEMALMRRIENAAARINETKQPLYDARRTRDTFNVKKPARIQRIKDNYKDKFMEPQISDTNILILQLKKFASGGEGTSVALLLAFLFLIIEAMPAILVVGIFGGDYMKRYLASLYVVRDLRDQRIAVQKDFASSESNIIRDLLYLQIIEKKSELVSNGFEDTEEMLILDQRLKLLNAGVNPNNGRSLDYIDLSVFDQKPAENSDATQEDPTIDPDQNEAKQDHKEPVFDL